MQKRGFRPQIERQVRGSVRATARPFRHQNHNSLFLKLSILAGFTLTLAACGGGGGGANIDPPAQNATTQTSQLSALPAAIAFGSVKTGSSATQTITLSNTGSASVTVSQATAAGTGFSLAGLSLPLSLAAGQSASFSAVFVPGSTGTFTGSVSIISNASNSPAAVSLTGTGAAAQTSVTPASVNFGSVEVGARSTATLTMTNGGTDAVTISQVSASGTGFSVSGPSLPMTLTSGRAASFAVAFTPVTAAASTGGVSIVSSASSQPVVIPLAGTGATITVALSPASLSFGSIAIGNSSVLPIVVTNNGSASVVISQATTTGAGFSVSGQTLPLTLASGQNASFNITFDPASAGAVAGSFSVISNAADSPAVSSLSATGANAHYVTLNWTASTSSGVTGYNVYSAAVSGGPYTKLNSSLIASTTYTDNTVQAGVTYYYVTTAVDSGGTESSYSNQATAVISSP